MGFTYVFVFICCIPEFLFDLLLAAERNVYIYLL